MGAINVSNINGRQFEGNDLGDRQRLSAYARLECKICWWVYDPAQAMRSGRLPGTGPTEWNFHAQGALALALGALAPDDVAAARCLAAAFDACVAGDIAIPTQESHPCMN